MPVKLNIILQSSIYKMHGKTGYSRLGKHRCSVVWLCNVLWNYTVRK